jgi:FlaA1/EpsC-like NDP-sugar epimerase
MITLKQRLNSIFFLVERVPFLPKWIIFGLDISIVFISFTISYLACLNLIKISYNLEAYLINALLCIVITGLFFFIFKTYEGIIRYAGFRDALRIYLSLLCANILLCLINILFKVINVHFFMMPDTGFFINFILTFTFVFFCKMIIRLLFDYIKTTDSGKNKSVRVLAYGVDTSIIEFVRFINHSDALKYKGIGFISTESNTANKRIANMPVYHIENVFQDRKVLSQFQGIVINPKEIDRKEKQMLLEQCVKCKKDLLSSPPMEDWSGDLQKLKNLKKVKIEDLLQRIPIEIDIESIAKNLKCKTLMITGAAGSIGSEIVRQVSKFDVGFLLICDVAESPLHEIGLELHDKYPHIKYKSIIANVRDYDLMRQIFEAYKPNLVYHAAAYKHVPLMEDHPCEAILTNVLGTKVIADLAVEYNTEVFIMISTDKAVNPSNVMGASKRIAEIYVQSLSKKLKEEKTAPRFITTRFGNVLGSNGSVIPRFEKQIKEGGPITVTHPDIFRYFMTISEACRLVLEAGNFGEGSEVFVFDMGEPVKIADMAEKMIRLAGLIPGSDIKIVYTGLRPGEKLCEELLYDEETVKPTHNPKIKIGSVKEYDYEEVKDAILELLEVAKAYQSYEVVKQMKKIIPEFISQYSEYQELD